MAVEKFEETADGNKDGEQLVRVWILMSFLLLLAQSPSCYIHAPKENSRSIISYILCGVTHPSSDLYNLSIACRASRSRF
jgi:hypothetical protein